MSSSTVSRTTVFGRLGADAEFKEIGADAIAVNFRLGTSHRLRRRGEYVDHTEWHAVKVVISAAQRPMWEDRLKRGRKVFVEGPRITDTVTREDGGKEYFAAIRAFPEDVILPDGAPQPRTQQPPESVEDYGSELPPRTASDYLVDAPVPPRREMSAPVVRQGKAPSPEAPPDATHARRDALLNF